MLQDAHQIKVLGFREMARAEFAMPIKYFETDDGYRK